MTPADPSPAPVSPEDYTKALLNMMEDFAAERERLENSQHAAINILDDLTSEKARLEELQSAMLNILEDFGLEREKAEDAHYELRKSYEALRVAKEAADAASREIESFAYSVSHDLRAPLRRMAGFSQFLLTDYRDKLDDEGKDYLDMIVSNAHEMGVLIEDLLKLSRVSRATMETEHVDLALIATSIIKDLATLHPDRQVSFVVAGNPSASGDKRLLTVALTNLLDNAWKFTRKQEKACITFGTQAQDHGQQVFFVKDNGAGFDMEYAHKLFNPFQRLHKVDEFPGTGIGLATVKRIIDRHGGRIWIEGEIGKGTTVHFTLWERT